MKNPRRSSRLTRIIPRNKLTAAGLATAALVIILSCVTAYYYFKTPGNTVIVTTADFPAELSTNVTPRNLTDHVEANLRSIIEEADANEVQDMARQEGFGSRPAKQTLIPIRALSNSPSPIFNLKWQGVDLNFCRSMGMSLKANSFLELAAIGVPEKGYRLTALLKEGPDYRARLSGTAPSAGGACSDFETCTYDLSEQILQTLDLRRLLSYYIKKNTPDANRRVIALYRTAIPANSLKPDDFVAWGNAFYGLGQYDEALEKYGAVLDKDPNYCPARVARGFVYYKRPHDGRQRVEDLKLAEQDFREGISCDPKNEYTRTSLCHILLQNWIYSPTARDDRLLVEAKEQCDKALEINPQFAIAAVNIGYVLYRQGKHEEALRHFDELSRRYPTNAALFLNYGFLSYLEYLKDNKPDMLAQATAQTLKSWNLNQKSDVAADNLGYFYYEQGNIAEAVKYWEKARELTPDDADCLAGLALGKYQLGDEKTAVALLARAIQIDPHYRDADYLEAKSSWSKRAASDLRRLVALLPRPSASGQ